MDDLAYTLVEAGYVGGIELIADERRLRDIVSAIKDAETVMPEVGIAIELTEVLPDFKG